MNGIKKTIAAILTFVMIVMMFPATTISANAAGDSYYEEFGISYEQLFTTYPSYLNPEQETAVVTSLMNAYKAALGEYGGDHDFLPSFIYALDQGGKDILSSEILGSFGIGKTTEEKLIAETSEALMREILKTESELASVTSEISGNFKSLKSTYNIATSAGKLVFINDLKSSCKNLSNSEIDKLADSLFKEESKLMGKVADGIEFWQLIVGIVELQELQEESICQLRDAMEDNSDFAQALDDLLSEIEKDPVAYMLEYYCTDKALELLSDAIETAYLAGRFAPSKLTVAVANIAIKLVTTVYPGAMADEIYQTTLLSSYVSEFDAAITSHRAQFILKKVKGELLGQDEIAEYEYLYNAYITTIRETLKSALDTAKTDGQRGNIQNAIALCNTFTYDTYIQWCMTAVKADIDAGVIAAPGSVAGNVSACVKGTYPAYGTVTITTDNTNIMDRPCSVNTDVTAKKIESGTLNAEYVVTGLCLNIADNYWYQVVTKAGETGYIYSGNCEHRAFLNDVTVSGLDVPNHISVGSRYYIRGTISTVYTNLTSISYIVYDDNGNKRTGGTVDVSGKTYVLDYSAIDAAAEFNLLEAGTYHCVLEATIENYSASDCVRENVVLDTAELVVGNVSALNIVKTSYVIGNGVTIPNNNVPADGTNKYCACGMSVGTGWHWCCWNYGYNVYSHVWGVAPNRYDSSTQYLRNIASADRTLTENHLQMYLKNAAPGALLRIDTDANPASGDNNGHTLVFVEMNATGTGAIFLEGNYDGHGRSRLVEWLFSSLVSQYGPGSYYNYQYIKYVSWPNAPAYCSESVPVCAYDVATGGVNSVFVRGWAYDPDTPSESVQIRVYMDGTYIGSGVANTWREDVHEVYGCGNMHGFDITLPVAVTETGNHSIEVYALNTNPDGEDKYLGQKTVTITAHTHSFTESVTKAETCTQIGIKTYTCESCGDTYTENIQATGHNYISEIIDATCTTVGHTAYTCSRCGDSYVEMSDGWSQWTTEYPTGISESLIEEKTQYSTLEKEYTTSTSDTLDGWTNIGTTYGDWGAVQTTTTKPTESDTLRITNITQTGWGYYHWCSYYDWTYCVDSIQVSGATQVEWHGYTSSFELPIYTIPDMGGQQSYGGDGNGAAACSRNFYIWFRNPDTDVYTYTYQTREKINQFYKWSDEWSAWSDNEAQANEDIQVKTQTVYRYYTGELADHKYNYTVTEKPTITTEGILTGICAGCSDTTTVALPKLNTTEYSYSIKTAATCTADGIGLYTWKTTAYGNYCFDVSIPATGHVLGNDNACVNCGYCAYVPGDLTGDNKINSLDGLLLMRYLNGWNVNIASPEAMDVNGDDKVNSLDGLILMRYLNGWNVTLG